MQVCAVSMARERGRNWLGDMLRLTASVNAQVSTVCSRMLTYAGVCLVQQYEYWRRYGGGGAARRMLTYAHVCSRMLAEDTLHQLQRYVV